MESPKKIKFTTLALSASIAVFSALAILAFLAYGSESENRMVRKAEKIIPYPAALIDNFHWVDLADFHDNSDSVKRFYENQDFSKLGMRIDFDTPDGEKRLKIKEKQVLGKMIEDEAIQILAEREKIQVADSDLTENVDERLAELGNEDAVKDRLMLLYGWTIQDFKEKVVRPSLYRERLEAVFDKKYQDSREARSRIEEAQNAISQKKKTFSDVVEEFSDGSSARSGGELGWFKKEQIVSQIAEQVFALKKGEQSAILESPLGFHIVELEERKKEGETEMVRIRQIFSAKETFVDWVGKEMSRMKIAIPLGEYFWNKEKGEVDFRSQELRDFEQQMLNDPKGDASAIF